MAKLRGMPYPGNFEKNMREGVLMKSCTICGTAGSPTVEHIIPQALLQFWEIDPFDPHGEPMRTTLCSRCNGATSALHNNAETLALIRSGGPVTKRGLGKLADWAVWVTMLLGVSRGGGVWPAEDARKRLMDRFARKSSGGIPKGTRVYAALADDETSRELEFSYAVALENDPRVIADYSGSPVGFAAGGTLYAAAVLRVGEVIVLVLGPTWKSGPDHRDRIDSIAANVGLTRIHPLPDGSINRLGRHTVAYRALHGLFVATPLDAENYELLPEGIRGVVESLFDRHS